eukprot:SAG31_NODE_424_length_15826_cov_4.954664_12_plen_175_part_00
MARSRQRSLPNANLRVDAPGRVWHHQPDGRDPQVTKCRAAGAATLGGWHQSVLWVAGDTIAEATPLEHLSKDILIFFKYAGIPGEGAPRDFVLFVVPTTTRPVLRTPARLSLLCRYGQNSQSKNAIYAHGVDFGTAVYIPYSNILTALMASHILLANFSRTWPTLSRRPPRWSI